MDKTESFPLFDKTTLDIYTKDTMQYYTGDIEKAMHLWPDGRMTSSTYEGIRGDDHYVIANYFEDTPYPEFMDLNKTQVQEVAAASLGVVSVVPETKMALKAENQVLTEEQQQVLQNSSFELADFCQGVDLNHEKLRELGVENPELRLSLSGQELKKPDLVEKYPLFNKNALDMYTEDTVQYYTKDIEKAMHLWPDGRMTSSTYEGVRGDDHYVIANYFENTSYPEFMDLNKTQVQEVAAASLGVVSVVPETKVALKAENQVLTEEQQQVLQNSSFELTDFCQGVDLNHEKLRELGVENPELRKSLSQQKSGREEIAEKKVHDKSDNLTYANDQPKQSPRSRR
ncbi:hypothetical protein [Listeria booriae]|uniref:hypothetical protein n=1 Tax=Listeria booriae TaxID=1552123 RepID=UPI00162A5CDB|nr:hypothetical protein [Listeria booriae]